MAKLLSGFLDSRILTPPKHFKANTIYYKRDLDPDFMASLEKSYIYNIPFFWVNCTNTFTNRFKNLCLPGNIESFITHQKDSVWIKREQGKDSIWLKSEFYLVSDGLLQSFPNSRSYLWLWKRFLLLVKCFLRETTKNEESQKGTFTSSGIQNYHQIHTLEEDELASWARLLFKEGARETWGIPIRTAESRKNVLSFHIWCWPFHISSLNFSRSQCCNFTSFWGLLTWFPPGWCCLRHCAPYTVKSGEGAAVLSPDTWVQNIFAFGFISELCGKLEAPQFSFGFGFLSTCFLVSCHCAWSNSPACVHRHNGKVRVVQGKFSNEDILDLPPTP